MTNVAHESNNNNKNENEKKKIKPNNKCKKMWFDSAYALRIIMWNTSSKQTKYREREREQRAPMNAMRSTWEGPLCNAITFID